ncbi:MAG: hypothetical protein US95_C0003G0005 [Candidatus Woesebacteria bacterium GW2011_GWB1_38_5]|uniref:DUF4446 domain-containing protein n=4 Tax=Candidatus Woeseibacteriota TaxID=1752722 RepID=A0A0G0KWY9_9BACT|nr:MAG: hypothetical protein US67_C0020G0016 [Candidatus Woesebacteria bacterium GW2011_GWD1_38_10]KKQ55537.1 MAG: hypothetical protein US75_C0019G0019 [Candidatus Woesebacteria bacterium GW2011_GWC1_38_13]KKQ75453.1 MAG: hypothetical protein US95_C0003G0005 [Candidatus Woesebacteria bacterium GW2011_GWB1_38_5]KKQ84198.1 MAG: hypothetical protein UT06_C0008G0022 [Candidatus Woesebacteria bacterium GW2011_GWA1_38_8]
MNITLTILFSVLAVFTLGSLSLSLYILLFFRRLSRNIGRSDLVNILNRLLDVEKQNSESVKNINKVIEEIKKTDLDHIQKVSLTRFNPFSELGGDHSFSIAILNGHLTGFLLTGLHTRERTRVYVKNVEKGRCEQELSKEEKRVLEKASVQS